jgi:SRSO17 transposase
LARLAIGVIDPQAWVIDDTGQAKEGTALGVRGPAVLRRPGQDRHCQVAVSVYAVTDAASAPLDWRL